MTLYHATTKDHLPSILEHGLIINSPANWEGMYLASKLYFAFDPQVSIDYVETSDTYDNKEIVVLKVDTKNLNIDNISYDWNNSCSRYNEINSIAYSKSISPEYIDIVENDEIDSLPPINFSDLLHMDNDAIEIYDKIYDTFWYEVESN